MDGLDLKVRPRRFRNAEGFLAKASAPPDPIRGQNIVRAGNHNRQLVLHHIRARGAISRVELADLTGLTQPAVFKITKDLLAEKWLTSTVMRDGSRGQPTSMMSLNPDAAFTVGLNVDRDHITFVVLDFAGGVRETIRRDILYPTPADVRQVFSKCFLTSQRNHARLSIATLGVGVSMPDEFARAAGNPWLEAQWRDTSVEDLLSPITDLPITRENDAAAAAIGEMMFGAGLSVDTFFYLYLSVGLGGGLVIKRHYFRGSHGRSGELGYLPQINPFRSSRSALGTPIEDFVSVPGLFKALEAAGCPATALDKVDWQAPAVQSAAIEWSKGAADLLYLPLLSTVCVVDPDAIFIGGGLPPHITERLALEINKRLSLNVGVNWPENAVRPGHLAADAAAIGAAVMAFRDVWDREHGR